jgi:hypothetical protein
MKRGDGCRLSNAGGGSQATEKGDTLKRVLQTPREWGKAAFVVPGF